MFFFSFINRCWWSIIRMLNVNSLYKVVRYFLIPSHLVISTLLGDPTPKLNGLFSHFSFKPTQAHSPLVSLLPSLKIFNYVLLIYTCESWSWRSALQSLSLFISSVFFLFHTFNISRFLANQIKHKLVDECMKSWCWICAYRSWWAYYTYGSERPAETCCILW